jgi:hypothetical protein
MGAAASSDANVLPPLSTALTERSVDLDEALLLDLPETFVYRLPPRTSAAGYAAESWGLDAPALTARLRVTSIAPNGVCVILWRRAPDAAAPSAAPPAVALIAPVTMAPSSAGWLIVAVARWETTPLPISHWLEPVLDSSRYFVLRCQPPPRAPQSDGSGRDRAAASGAPLIGIGFRMRESAFALKAVLADYERACARQMGVAESSADAAPATSELGAATASVVDDAPARDVTAPAAAPPAVAAVSRRATAAPSALIPVLAPPRRTAATAAIQPVASAGDVGDDEFGDFS